ncbi:MAG: CatB-related O-acetyltransferase [Bacteroidales bacterium]|nr:CatB-related O-acetyltransferase [Bacteroidales bacterium]
MVKSFFFKFFRKIIRRSCPEIEVLFQNHEWGFIDDYHSSVALGKNVKVYSPSHISKSSIGDYTYIAMNSYISGSAIGRFCSIGPNLVCGWGIHPTNGISTAPMFYSTMKQNGMTLSMVDKIEERKPIIIGNDVFIGANVTVLDGVTIGDGAVIGAGSVVSKDIPPFAVAVGCPIEIVRYRFDSDKIEKLQRIKWWEFDDEKLKEVEQYFFDLDGFINQQ